MARSKKLERLSHKSLFSSIPYLRVGTHKTSYELLKANILDWIGLDWIGLDWIGLDWIGLIK